MILLVHQSLLVLIIVCFGRVPCIGCPERTSAYFDVDKECFDNNVRKAMPQNRRHGKVSLFLGMQLTIHSFLFVKWRGISTRKGGLSSAVNLGKYTSYMWATHS